MTLKKELDAIDWQILTLLQQNARLAYAQIGRQVNLSSPAVTERIKQMEDMGIIEGYYTHLNFENIGLPVMVFIEVSVPVEKYSQFKKLIRNLDGIVECHHITGNTAFILKVVLKSISCLESMVSKLSKYGQTTSSIVMSSLVINQIIK